MAVILSGIARISLISIELHICFVAADSCHIVDGVTGSSVKALYMCCIFPFHGVIGSGSHIHALFVLKPSRQLLSCCSVVL